MYATLLRQDQEKKEYYINYISTRGAGERYFFITILLFIVVYSLGALWRPIAVVPLRVCWKFSSINRCYV